MAFVVSGSPIALFVSLTRVVRESSLDPEARDRAFEVLERMASSFRQAGFSEDATALMALARQHEALALALEPYWASIQALQPTSLR